MNDSHWSIWYLEALDQISQIIIVDFAKILVFARHRKFLIKFREVWTYPYPCVVLRAPVRRVSVISWTW